MLPVERNKYGLFETIAVESASMVLRNYHKPFFFNKQTKLIVFKERNFFYFSRNKRGLFETIAVESASRVYFHCVCNLDDRDFGGQLQENLTLDFSENFPKRNMLPVEDVQVCLGKFVTDCFSIV